MIESQNYLYVIAQASAGPRDPKQGPALKEAHAAAVAANGNSVNPKMAVR